MAMKRLVWRVRWSKTRGMWTAIHAQGGNITQGRGSYESYHEIKCEAVASARICAKQHFKNGGLSQLVIYNKDGKIQTEYTYGKDPKRYKS